MAQFNHCYQINAAYGGQLVDLALKHPDTLGTLFFIFQHMDDDNTLTCPLSVIAERLGVATADVVRYLKELGSLNILDAQISGEHCICTAHLDIVNKACGRKSTSENTHATVSDNTLLPAKPAKRGRPKKTGSEADRPVTCELPRPCELPKPFQPSGPDLQIFSSRAIMATASMIGRPTHSDPNEGISYFDAMGVRMTVRSIRKLLKFPGMSIHLLLVSTVAEFTAGVLKNGGKLTPELTQVHFSLSEYLKRKGREIAARPTNDDNEARVEEKKVKLEMRDVRKTLRDRITMLGSISLQWHETEDGQQIERSIDRLIDGGHVEGDDVWISLSPQMAEYLVSLPVKRYPVALFGLDGPSGKSYNISGCAMGLMMLDSDRRTEDPVHVGYSTSVSELLEVALMPPISPSAEREMPADVREARTRHAFEDAMNALVDCGFLEKWSYFQDDTVTSSDDIDYEAWRDRQSVFFQLR